MKYPNEHDLYYQKLVERYVNKQLSPKELEVFYHLLEEGKLNGHLLESMDRDIEVINHMPAPKHHWFIYRYKLPVSIAATLLILLGIVLINIQNDKLPKGSQIVQDKLPGGQKAVLVLSNGKTIQLNDAPRGKLNSSDDVQINKEKDGTISYSSTIPRHSRSSAMEWNTIKVPKGGNCRVILEDGTRVLLNASSSLTFPNVFSGQKRTVKLTGEAYFEVTPSARAGHKSFVVETSVQKVEVLGTTFNVNAYLDEDISKTTLLEGKVKVITVSGERMLRPGDQSHINKRGIGPIIQVDPETAVDWKNGDFIFSNEGLRSVMRKLSRWYDIDVVYQEGMADETLSGQVSRNKKLSEVLGMLSLSADLSYKIKDNVLYLYTKGRGHNKTN